MLKKYKVHNRPPIILRQSVKLQAMKVATRRAASENHRARIDGIPRSEEKQK